MLTLIHGDDTTTSRNAYVAERQKSPEKKIINGTSVTLTDLMQVFSGNGLFGDQETIFIEELVSKRKSPKDVEELVGFLSDQADATIFVWESKLLTPKQVSGFKNAVVKEFKIPTIVFAFLDSLRPNNTQQMLKMYHDVLEQEDATYVLVMLMRQVRILLALSNYSLSNVRSFESKSSRDARTISEVSRMSPWQLNKLQKQVKVFTQEKLLHMHTQLFELEKGQKTGTLTLSLPQSIDFFLLSI